LRGPHGPLSWHSRSSVEVGPTRVPFAWFSRSTVVALYVRSTFMVLYFRSTFMVLYVPLSWSFTFLCRGPLRSFVVL